MEFFYSKDYGDETYGVSYSKKSQRKSMPMREFSIQWTLTKGEKRLFLFQNFNDIDANISYNIFKTNKYVDVTLKFQNKKYQIH